MKTKLKVLTAVFFILSSFLSQAYAQEYFYVQRVTHNGVFIINGNQFTARDPCDGFKRGSLVQFTEGSPHGYCLSAVFVNMHNGRECSVWCH